MDFMSQFETAIFEIKKQIFHGDLDEAMICLSQVKPTSKVNYRELSHIEGVILMRKGRFQEAIDLFLNSSKKYGNNICLLTDLAACYYLTGQMQSWMRILDLAEFEYQQGASLISWEIKAKFLLTFGKMREEQGALSEALQIYYDARDICFSHSMEPEGKRSYIKSLAQILRIRSQYGYHASVSNQYRQLIHHSVNETDSDCVFESEHALMIFETKCWGANEGIVRFKKLLRNPIMATQEATLVYSDLIYELMMSKFQISEQLLIAFQKLKNLSPADEIIRNLALGNYPTSEEMIDWPNFISPAAHLRLLGLCIKLNINPLICKKFQFLIQGLSKNSIKMWINLIESSELVKSGQFVYNSKTQILYCDGESINLSSKPAFQEILEILRKQKSILNSEVLRILWKIEENETNLSRLRMRVRRFNSEIEKHFSKKNFIRMSNSSLSISYQVVSSFEVD